MEVLMDYLALKHAHAGMAYLSALLFLVRFGLAYAGSGLMRNKLLKVMPHVIDTLLLVLAIILCIQLGQYPLTDGWLTTKLLGLVLLIGTGVVAIRKRNLLFAVLTLLLYVFIIGVAKTHNSLSWFSLF
jgi:uncharacterized membrane protein SirB2